jgi:hypothetical protein
MLFVSSSDGEWYFGCLASIFYGFWNCVLEETEGIFKFLLSSASAGYQLVQIVAFIIPSSLSSRQFAGLEFCMR